MDTKVIIYGAGARGRGNYEFFERYGKEDAIIGFCDRNYSTIKEIKGKRVMSFEEAKKYHVPFLISITEQESIDYVKQKIEKENEIWINLDDMAEFFGKDRVSFNREFCAAFHINSMEQYYEDAEKYAGIESFWREDSLFFNRFKELDLRNVIELACGRGRHVSSYLHKAGSITLVDILEENIHICEERFSDEKKIKYYCNNGYNLKDLPSEKYTALFCYDAMVHFEMMDIYEYLKDIYRVLVSGGKALIHHSNNTMDYKASFSNAPYGRSFMSKDIFAYLAYRIGFEILDQKIIDWGVKDLDCISLIRKP